MALDVPRWNPNRGRSPTRVGGTVGKSPQHGSRGRKRDVEPDTCRLDFVIIHILRQAACSLLSPDIADPTTGRPTDPSTEPLARALNDGLTSKDLPWPRTIDLAAFTCTAHQVRTGRATSVSMITAVVPIDPLFNSVPGQPNQIHPRFLRSRAWLTECTHTSDLR